MFETVSDCLNRMVKDVIEHPFLKDSNEDILLTNNDFLSEYPSDLKVMIGYVQDTCNHILIDNKERYIKQRKLLVKGDNHEINLITQIVHTPKGMINY